ncbi:MAG: hypoxanthine phosphoribosyltransferase, partial [Phascolarctobacterium sp.]|nr:hypoxanthine phosphoribosyltransferase [Phascolarctobacterium sp.]
MEINKDIKQVLLTKEQIEERVREMGKEITAAYEGKELVVIILLTGAAWFAADLTRAINLPLRTDFMVASSYGNSTDSSGNVRVYLDIREDIAGKDVLLVDDIIDRGITFAAISNMLKEHRPLSLKTVA